MAVIADRQDTPIAIIGLGGLFPGSTDLTRFWRTITGSVDCVTEVPDTHWRIADYHDPDPAAPDKTYCRRGGFLPTVPFDPAEFGLPPRTLEVTDVLQLLSLLVARDTLADAGCPGAAWYDRARTGVVLGVTGASSLTQPLASRLQTPLLKQVLRASGITATAAAEIAENFARAFAPWEENSFPGMLSNVVAGRIANRFDLGATNTTVDAACASSLAAVRFAAAELALGRADLMLTGGCDAESTIFSYLCFAKTPAFSRSERIRPLDAEADGTLIGEGIGMLALKRLDDARRDNDRIYAVLRGIGSSSDGRFNSIYAPRAEGQMRALRRAYAAADVCPSTVGLVECHGTGTAMGDRTELAALCEVYAEATDERHTVAVGSVKSQIGHTQAAAGAAGLIKVALALHQKILPPTINVDRPAAVLADSPFYVNRQTRPWVVEPGRPRRRGVVSSFGFGGTNFHCVLEETPVEPLVLHPVARVDLWHAPSSLALLTMLDLGAAPVEEGWPVPADHARLAVVSNDDSERKLLLTEAISTLRADPGAVAFTVPAGAFYRRRAAELGKVAVLCAGQGSQYVNMGAAAAMALPPIRAAYDAAALAFTANPPLGRVVFPPPAFDDTAVAQQEATLRRTEYAQPAIGALSMGHFRYLSELGFIPDGALGHSFGELTALWCARSITDEEFLALATARGMAMSVRPDSGSDSGAMIVVHAGRELLDPLLAQHSGFQVCNINGPGQFVVGGAENAVQPFLDACREAGVQAARLPVSAAFHTPFVAHAVAAFRSAVESADLRPPSIPVYANTSDAEYGPDKAANRAVLTGHLLRPVAFAPRVEQMYADGYRVFVEIGPKRVLSGLVRQILIGRDDIDLLAADPGPGRDSDRALKQTAARLAVLGLPLTGFNRYNAIPRPASEPSGMSIPLNGANYVSADRRAYLAELDAPALLDAEEPAALPSAALGEHLAAHNEYLAGQLRIAERLAALLHHQSERGGIDDNTLRGITSLTEHSLAIGRSHMHASDALRCLAQLDNPRPFEHPPHPPEPTEPREPVSVGVLDLPAADTAMEALLEVTAEKTGYPTSMLDPGMDLEADLGVDSIKRVEIMSALRERFPGSAQAGPEQLAELRTLADIGAFLREAAEPGTVVSDPKAGEPRRLQARPRQLPPPDLLVNAYTTKRALVVGSAPLADRFARALTRTGWLVYRDQAEDDLDLVVWIAPELPVSWPEGVEALSTALLLAQQTQHRLLAAADRGRAAFLAVTRSDPLCGGVTGLIKTLAIEAPEIFCRAVDLDPALGDDHCTQLLLAECGDAETYLSEVIVNADRTRHTISLAERGHSHRNAVEVAEPDDQDLLVITGGGRGITAACAIGLARRYRTGLLLLGRTALTDEHDQATVPAQREIRATVDAIRRTGAFVQYLTVDVADPEATAQALKPYRNRISGVVHGAGVCADQLIVHKRLSDARRVLTTKLGGLAAVLDAVDRAQLRHLVLFSSVAGFFGNRGQADYAMANEALNRTATALKREHPRIRVTSINWGAWDGGMVTPGLAREFAVRGVPTIPVPDGVAMFVEQFQVDRTDDVVCAIGPCVPLSAPESAKPPAGSVTVRRDIRGLHIEPVLAAHLVDRVPVLPATAALGAMINVARRLRPEREVRQVHHFAVLQGLVFDGTQPEAVEVVITEDTVTIQETDGRPRYRARALTEPPAPQRLDGLPRPGGTSLAEVYTDGTLFHGPALRGITAALAEDPRRMVLACRAHEIPLGAGAFGDDRFSPVLADLLLQAAMVRVRRSLGRASLPTGVKHIELHAALPDRAPFLVVVDELVDTGTVARCTVTACTPDGSVLLRFRGAELVSSPELAAKFTG